jgi:hypothetical protein
MKTFVLCLCLFASSAIGQTRQDVRDAITGLDKSLKVMKNLNDAELPKYYPKLRVTEKAALDADLFTANSGIDNYITRYRCYCVGQYRSGVAKKTQYDSTLIFAETALVLAPNADTPSATTGDRRLAIACCEDATTQCDSAATTLKHYIELAKGR